MQWSKMCYSPRETVEVKGEEVKTGTKMKIPLSTNTVPQNCTNSLNYHSVTLNISDSTRKT